MSVIQSSGSITHTYGNVACLAMEYIKSYFDDDFFKVVHMSTKLAYKQLDTFKTKKEFWKLHKPMLIARPRIEPDDSSKFFYGAAMMNRIHNVKNAMEYANRVKLLEDKTNGVRLEFLWNRCKIYYDIVIIVDTYNQQLNLLNYLDNLIIPNTPFMIDTALESYVPVNIINSIADFRHIKRDETGDVIKYLNTFGEVPFTYKYKNGSGNEEYFALYPTRVEAIASEISIDEGSEKGIITDSYTLSFTLSCEFNAMSCYYLTLRDSQDNYTQLMPEIIDRDEKVVPLFTIPILANMKLEQGWKILSSNCVFCKKDMHEVEEIPLKLATDVASKINRIMKYQKHTNISPDMFFRIKVFKDMTELPNDETGFTYDLSNPKEAYIRIYDINVRVTYRVIILIHMEYINRFITEINQFDKET